MVKKNRKKKENNTEFYTITEKINKCIYIKQQIKELGLEIYVDEMNELSGIINNYIKQDIEYIGKIKLPGSKRIMDIMLRNNKKWDIIINLKYDENV